MKTLRALFGVAVIAAALYVGWSVAPPYFRNYQLQDSMETAARFSAVDPRLTEEDIRQKVYKEAQQIGVLIDAEQINVSRVGNEVVIWADYNVHIDLPFRPLNLDFHPATKNKKL